MARWKLCASPTFQILPLSTCTLCQQKSYISKFVQPIFEIFASARRFWGWAFGWKVSGAQVFYVWNGNVKTLSIDNIWKFATFNLYTVPAKILYLQICSTDFRNLCLSSKVLRVGIWVKSFRCAGILRLQWECENFVHRQHLKVCHFQPVHCASKNAISPKVCNRFSTSLPQFDDFEDGNLGVKFLVRRYFTFSMARWKLCPSTTFESVPLSTSTLCQQKSYISKGIQPIFEIFPSARRFRGWAFGWKLQVRRYFTFSMARWELCASTTFESLPLSTCTLCQQKSYISKGIQPIFEILASAGRFCGWAFGWKDSGAQIFYFCNGKVKTLPIDNIWKLATFNLHTVVEKILYLQRYSTYFRSLSLSSKILSVDIGVESFRSAGILLLQWQGENFAHRQHLKVCHVQPVHCASKNLISPRVFNRFSKSLPHFKDVECGHWGGKLQVRRHFAFAIARWKLCASTIFEILPLSTCTLGSKNAISPKVFNRFSTSLYQFEDVEGGNWGGMFEVRRYFTFAMARWKLCASTIFEILPLSTCTLWQQKSYISKSIQPIFEIFASVRRCWGWA